MLPTNGPCLCAERIWLDVAEKERSGHPADKGCLRFHCPGVTNQERQAIYAYLLAAETEYFRAHRNYAGVLHFDYLTGDFNGAITGDIFRDPESLEPWKVYDGYFTEIFKPLGVYVNFFAPDVQPSSTMKIPVMLVNDEYQTLRGRSK